MIQLPELLNQLYTEELADTLGYLNISRGGSKTERVQRLLSAKLSAHEMIERMNAETLRHVCRIFDIRTGRKAEMIERIKAGLDVDKTTVQTPRRPEYRPIKKENVLEVLEQLVIPGRKARDEKGALNEILLILKQNFEGITDEYYIGGYFNLRIDIDVGNGQVGVEVKHASSLARKSHEAHRLIGQAVYYQRRCYHDNLIVIVVGNHDEITNLGVQETLEFLKSLGASVVTIATT